MPAVYLLTSLKDRLASRASRHTRAVVLLVLGAASVLQVGRLAAFMVDPARQHDSVRPESVFYLQHSCLTAHFQAARVQRGGVSNVYESSHYVEPDGEPAVVEGFACDPYLYPPTALLLPRLALAVSSDFLAWRTTWFFIEAVFIGVALVLLAHWVGGPRWTGVVMVGLIVFAAPTTRLALQIGNVHLVVITASAVAMVAFDRKAHAVGGVLLAWGIATKLFPGILLLLLLLQRRWRAAAWTATWGMLLVIASVAVLGKAPFEAFVTYHLPRLASGESLASVFAYPATALVNDGILGLAQKLALVGVPEANGVLQVAIPRAYLVVLAAATFIGATASTDRRAMALAWLALLQLASLQSPFVPDVYAHFAWVWMLALMLASEPGPGWRLAALLVALVLAARQDYDARIASEAGRAALAILQQAGWLTFTLWVVWASREARGVVPVPRVQAA